MSLVTLIKYNRYLYSSQYLRIDKKYNYFYVWNFSTYLQFKYFGIAKRIIIRDEEQCCCGYRDLPALGQPWKSRLGLLYTYQRTFWMDIKLIVATILAVLDREKALQMVHKMLMYINADNALRLG